MRRSVVYGGRARDDLAQIEELIRNLSGSADLAQSYVEDIMRMCRGLADFPFRGLAVDLSRPGSRLLGFRRRGAISFRVEEERVVILRVYYGRQSLFD